MDGVLDKDIANVVTTIECNYEVGNDKGTYAVTATATHKNYDFTSVNGTLTVGAKKVVLDAKTYSVTYGEDCPELVDFTSDSVSVTLDFITLSTSYIKGEFANEYKVFATSSNANYTVDASKVKLVVEKRALTLTLVESSLFATYGEEIEITYTNVGLLANDAKHFDIEYKTGDVCKPVPDNPRRRLVRSKNHNVRQNGAKIRFVGGFRHKRHFKSAKSKVKRRYRHKFVAYRVW